MVSSLIDRFLCDFTHHRKERRWTPFIWTLLVGAAYLGWIVYVGVVKGYWVYPVLDVLDFNGRVAFFTGGAIILFLAYYFSEFLTSLVVKRNDLLKSKPKRIAKKAN